MYGSRGNVLRRTLGAVLRGLRLTKYKIGEYVPLSARLDDIQFLWILERLQGALLCLRS
jgi:hypothetical protein